MKKQLFTAFALGLSLLSGMAMAQNAPTRLRGTIQQVTDSTLAITTRAGQTVTVALNDKTHALGIRRATIGRASSREREGQDGSFSVVTVPFQKKHRQHNIIMYEHKHTTT